MTANIAYIWNEFPLQVEEIVRGRNITYMEAIQVWCEWKNVEIEVAGDYIRKSVVLKAKIQEEAEELNYLPKTTRLPI